MYDTLLVYLVFFVLEVYPILLLSWEQGRAVTSYHTTYSSSFFGEVLPPRCFSKGKLMLADTPAHESSGL